MNKKKTLVVLRDVAIIGLIVLGISAWQTRHMLSSDGNTSVENQVLVSLYGHTSSIAQPGKRTLVYFFAPWCNICKLSINNLDYLSSDDLHVVRVALDYQNKNEVENFVLQNEVEGEVLLGTETLKDKFQIQGYPTYYLLDGESKVVARSFGYSTALGLRLTNYLNSN